MPYPRAGARGAGLGPARFPHARLPSGAMTIGTTGRAPARYGGNGKRKAYGRLLLVVALALAATAGRPPAHSAAQARDCDPPLPPVPPARIRYFPPTYSDVTRHFHAQRLPEVLSDGWTRYERLQAAVLESHRLTAIEADAFVSLPRLQVLIINNFGREPDVPLASLPPDLFRPLPCLRELHWSDTRLTALPPDLFAHTPRLERLHLQDTQLTALPPDLFARTPRLERLHLQDNRLATLPPDLFAHTPRLERLHLQDNRLAALPPTLFRGLDRLEDLFLDHNRLATLPPDLFRDLDRLQTLDLSDNALATLPPDLFRGLDRLQTLRLSDNALATLPPGLFVGLPRLRALWLVDNQLMALPPTLFRDLNRLQTLWLSRNQLTCLPPGLFRDLDRLQNLSLHRNRLGNLAPAFLQALGLPQVRDLELGPQTDRSARRRQSRPFGVYDGASDNALPAATFARYAAVVSGLEALTLSADAPLTYPVCPQKTAPAVAVPRAVRFTPDPAGPQVGHPLAATTVPPGTGPVAWHWERCDAAAGRSCREIGFPAAARAVYVPGLADAGRYLRAYLPYLASDGVWTRLQSPLAGPVAPRRCPARRVGLPVKQTTD